MVQRERKNGFSKVYDFGALYPMGTTLSVTLPLLLSPVCKAPIIVVFGLPLCCGYGVTVGNTYCVTLCNWVPLITVTLAVGFLVWYFLKWACPLDGTGDSGQSPRAFWTWSHALWLKVGNSVIYLWICVCLWHPWYKVRWIMCNERCGYYFHDIWNIYRYFWCWNISTRDHDGSKSPSTYCHDD